MAIRISFRHCCLLRKTAKARSSAASSAAPSYWSNRKPLPFPDEGSNSCTLSFNPPVALTIGMVPYFRL